MIAKPASRRGFHPDDFAQSKPVGTGMFSHAASKKMKTDECKCYWQAVYILMTSEIRNGKAKPDLRLPLIDNKSKGAALILRQTIPDDHTQSMRRSVTLWDEL